MDKEGCMQQIKTELLEENVTNKQQLALLQKLLAEGLKLIENTVIENITCKNLPKARGISIYFPTRRIHNSYHKTLFAKNNRWPEFLETYLRKTAGYL